MHADSGSAFGASCDAAPMIEINTDKIYADILIWNICEAQAKRVGSNACSRERACPGIADLDVGDETRLFDKAGDFQARGFTA